PSNAASTCPHRQLGYFRAFALRAFAFSARAGARSSRRGRRKARTDPVGSAAGNAARRMMSIIRVAILGQGRSGRDIHGAHLSKDAERYRIVAVADPLEERRQRAQAEYGCETFADHRPLLERDDLDLVVNATPSRFHVPLTLEFLEAGFNTLCDKPLASPVAARAPPVPASQRAAKL